MLIGRRSKRQHMFWYARSYFISRHWKKSEPCIVYPQFLLSHTGESDICLTRSVFFCRCYLCFMIKVIVFLSSRCARSMLFTLDWEGLVLYVYVNVYVYINVYVSVYVYLYIYDYVYVYLFVYVYVHIYYIYIYQNISRIYETLKWKRG